MEHWRNDSDRGKQKYVEKNLSQWHCLLLLLLLLLLPLIIIIGPHCSPLRTFASSIDFYQSAPFFDLFLQFVILRLLISVRSSTNSTTLCTTNLTWTDLGSNPGLRLSHSAALRT